MYQRLNSQLLDSAQNISGLLLGCAGIIGQADGMDFTSASGFSGIFDYFCLGSLK